VYGLWFLLFFTVIFTVKTLVAGLPAKTRNNNGYLFNCVQTKNKAKNAFLRQLHLPNSQAQLGTDVYQVNH
jgi:hypothetical protein